MLKLSGNKALLLRLFYTNPDRDFYIQEIGRILEKKPGVFQRTLCLMEREEILKSEYKANARYFRANKDYPLYEELKSIVNKTIGVIGGIKKVLENAGPIDFAFLYGSFAKGQEYYLSDIDLILIGSPDEGKILREFEIIEKNIMREINYRLYKREEYLENVRQRDPFLLGILKDQKTMLIGEENELRDVIEGSSHKKAEPGLRTDKKSVEKSQERFVDRRGRRPD
jgi:predicted nucleotidyltransferase